jgi:hypothetical protein
MEFTEKSDCDLIVVLTDDALGDDYPNDKARQSAREAAQVVYGRVWELLKGLELKPPKETGTFSTPTSQAELCSKKNVGNSQEDMKVLAKRQLLLLESQPVYRTDECENLTTAVVDSYAEGLVRDEPHKEWGFLINDLVRYFRSLSVNYQWDFNNEHGKWPIRNIKLRHSRLVMFSGLLFLLGECSRNEDKVSWLRRWLKLTPLERLAFAYESTGDTNFFRVAGFYNTFLGMLSRPDVREELNGAEVGSYQKRYDNPSYALLKPNSDALIAELLRFVLDRRGLWTERFFEYLIF